MLPAIEIVGTNRGWATTKPSTLEAPSFAKLAVVTLTEVKNGSSSFWPVRLLSLRLVNTLAFPATGVVHKSPNEATNTAARQPARCVIWWRDFGANLREDVRLVLMEAKSKMPLPGIP